MKVLFISGKALVNIQLPLSNKFINAGERFENVKIDEEYFKKYRKFFSDDTYAIDETPQVETKTSVKKEVKKESLID